MARRVAIPFKHMALRVVGPFEAYLAARIQRLDMPINIPTTDVDELGNQYHAGTTVDIPEITSTFQAMDVSIKLYAALTGTDPNNYPNAGVDIGNLGEVDVIGVVRDANVADYVKSLHLRKCMVTGFTYTYSVDAESTEEYTVSGNEKRWFRYDIIVDTYVAASASPQALTQTALQLKNAKWALSVVLDAEYLDEVTGAPATGEYQITGAGTSISFADVIGTMLVVVYHANPAGNNWVPVLDNTIPAAIRGKNVPVSIALNEIPRVQSVTIRGTFPNEVIKEMGNTSVVGTVTQVPQVTGDISVLDTDLQLIALLTTGELAPSGVIEFRDCEFTASGLSLRIILEDPTSGCEDVGTPTILKTVYIPEITVTSEGHTTNVGGNATQTIGFKSNDGRLIVYSGAMPS